VRALLKHSGIAVAVGLAVGLAAALLVPLGPAASASSATIRPVGAATLVVRRDKPPVVVPVAIQQAGEAALDLVANAPGVSWGAQGRESAVVSVDVDGRYVTDIVVPSSRRTPRSLALGHLGVGRHRVTLRFAADRSPAGASSAQLRDVRVSSTIGDAELARRHAPVLLGRALPELGGPFQNAITDTPLLAWHEFHPSPVAGARRLVYSIVWSNEDGGTDSPALMARWGRTTDIEWVYGVDVNAAGDRVGSGWFHGPGHTTVPYGGRHEGDHPVLQTCTVNNTVCDTATGPMRFFLAGDQTRPAWRAREYLMDTNPWTYPVMAEELEREGKIESPSDPATPAVGDQRTYLYLEVDKDTAPAAGSAPGASVLVRLRDDPTVYRSDHGVPSWSIPRDDPAATTVELPAGTTPADVVEVSVTRVPAVADNGAEVTVTDVNRAFFLGRNRQPQPSFIAVHGLATRLTAAAPTAPVWSNPA